MDYLIGRRMPSGPMRPCCRLRFDKGQILFEETDTDFGPSQAERTHILRHFADPTWTMEAFDHPNGAHVDTLVDLAPGTEAHFRAAVYKLPLPFSVRPGGSR